MPASNPLFNLILSTPFILKLLQFLFIPVLYCNIFIIICQLKGFPSSLQLSSYKNVVDRTDRSLKITVFHTDDNIQFTGSLIDHLYIDMIMCQC